MLSLLLQPVVRDDTKSDLLVGLNSKQHARRLDGEKTLSGNL